MEQTSPLRAGRCIIHEIITSKGVIASNKTQTTHQPTEIGRQITITQKNIT